MTFTQGAGTCVVAATLHLAEGNSDLALSVYEQIVKLGDCGPDVMITLGQLRIENGQTNEALVAFQTAIKGGRNDSRPYLYIAQIYAETGTYLVNAEKFAQWLLEEFEFNNETLMVAPAAGFYSTKGEGYNQVRIAYVLNQESLQNAINCLEEALKLYPGRI